MLVVEDFLKSVTSDSQSCLAIVPVTGLVLLSLVGLLSSRGPLSLERPKGLVWQSRSADQSDWQAVMVSLATKVSCVVFREEVNLWGTTLKLWILKNCTDLRIALTEKVHVIPHKIYAWKVITLLRRVFLQHSSKGSTYIITDSTYEMWDIGLLPPFLNRHKLKIVLASFFLCEKQQSLILSYLSFICNQRLYRQRHWAAKVSGINI